MKNPDHLYDPASVARLPRTTATRRSALGLSRFSFAPNEAETPPPGPSHLAPPQDAQLLIFQLRTHPRHRLWQNGREMLVPESPEGCLNVIDLSQGVAASFEHHVDSWHLHMPKAALDDVAEDAGAPAISGLHVPEPWVTTDPVVQHLSPLVLQAMQSSEQTSSLFADHVMLALVSHVADRYGGMRARACRPGALAPWQATRAKDLMADNLGKEVSLLEVARQCGLSPAYFSRAFKITTGTTPHGWLQECRVDRARNLLRGSMSLAEIALTCGFADQSHFTRIFKRAAGVGPGEWRRLRKA